MDLLHRLTEGEVQAPETQGRAAIDSLADSHQSIRRPQTEQTNRTDPPEEEQDVKSFLLPTT